MDSEQCLAQLCIVNTGIHSSTAGILIGIIQIVQIGDGAATVMIIEREIQCLLILVGNITASYMGPGFTVRRVTDIHCHLCGKQVNQGTVVENMGGDKVIGTDRIGNVGVVLTDVLGG